MKFLMSVLYMYNVQWCSFPCDWLPNWPRQNSWHVLYIHKYVKTLLQNAFNFFFISFVQIIFFSQIQKKNVLSSCCKAKRQKRSWKCQQLENNVTLVPAQMLTVQSLLSQQLLSIFEEPCYLWINQLRSERITHSKVETLPS